MAIAGSGAISLSDFRTEFVGGSAAISLGDLYRGGSNIRAKAANNNATNLAAGVPTSGVIAFDDFYGTAKGFRKTYSSGATNQDASDVFGDDYGVDYPKEIVINSGVELGATSTSQEALQIDSGLSGTMTITNNGTLTGAGGAAGAAGGDAFQADVACTLINNGTIRAGGGGGGAGGSGGNGGTGGQGRTSYQGYTSWSSYNGSGGYNAGNSYGAWRFDIDGSWIWFWAGSIVAGNVSATQTGSNPQYQRQTSSNGNQYFGDPFNTYAYRFPMRRRTLTTLYNYFNGGGGGSGGSGGAGGVGAGYNQSAGSGSAGGSGSGGSAGGTNAGAGGSGGNGGSGGAGGGFGQAGSTGSNGATGNSGGNGNYTNGSGGSGGGSGSGGGAAGKYLRGSSFVTFTNNGTVQGGTA